MNKDEAEKSLLEKTKSENTELEKSVFRKPLPGNNQHNSYETTFAAELKNVNFENDESVVLEIEGEAMQIPSEIKFTDTEG